MSKKKEKSPYDKFYEEVHPQMKLIHKYVEKTRDKNSAIIKEANEAIDYNFEDFDKKEIRDKYKKALTKSIDKHTKDIKITGLGNKKLEDRLRQNLGIISKEQVERIVEGMQEKYNPQTLREEMEGVLSQFSRQHYAGITSDYALSEEGRKHLVKYLGLEDKVKVELLTPDHFQRLMAAHGGTRGDIHSSQIPLEVALHKSDKNKPKKKKK